LCDVAENCTGSAAACPPDGVWGTSHLCRALDPNPGCDAPDYCTGAKVCPDAIASAGTFCRSAEGVCDTAEYCTGSSAWCPGSGPYLPAGTSCRGARDAVCDVAEVCTGSSPYCPADTIVSGGCEYGGTFSSCAGPPSCFPGQERDCWGMCAAGTCSACTCSCTPIQ
jgi:hypothetical protein